MPARPSAGRHTGGDRAARWARWRGFVRIVRGFGVLVLVAILGAFWLPAGLLAIVTGRSLPQDGGAAQVTGLGASVVTSVRDARGIAHVTADTPHDLFFAQGYVHAQRGCAAPPSCGRDAGDDGEQAGGSQNRTKDGDQHEDAEAPDDAHEALQRAHLAARSPPVWRPADGRAGISCGRVQRASKRPQPEPLGAPHDGVGKDDVGQADTEMGDHRRGHSPANMRRAAPRQRGNRIWVALEQAGFAIGDETARAGPRGTGPHPADFRCAIGGVNQLARRAHQGPANRGP